MATDARTDTDHLRRFDVTPGRYFLQVSRLVPEKRQLDLIEAFASLPPNRWKLVLVGDANPGAYRDAVRQAAERAGVVLTGYLNGVPLQQLYSHAGAFVLTSSHEGLPIALLEGLSYGLPVLASAIPANIEIGLPADSYFPLGDTAALAAKMARLTEAPPDPKARAAVRAWVAQQYDWDRIAGETLDIYRRVRGTSPHPVPHPQ